MFVTIMCIIAVIGVVFLGSQAFSQTKSDNSTKSNFQKLGGQERLVGKSLSQIEAIVGTHIRAKDEIMGSKMVHVYTWGSIYEGTAPRVELYFDDNKKCIGVKTYVMH